MDTHSIKQFSALTEKGEINMAQIRMYVQKGCPHCEQAKNFFDVQNVSVESIEIGFDPILQAGIRSLTGGQNFQVPLIVSFATQEVVLGNDPVQLQRIIAALVPSTKPSDSAS